MQPEVGANVELIFQRMIRMQLIVTIIAIVIASLLAGVNGALSAMAGGLAVVAGWLISARLASKANKTSATAALLGLLKALIIKIFVIAAMLWAAFEVLIWCHRLVPVALMISFIGVTLCALLFFRAASVSIMEK